MTTLSAVKDWLGIANAVTTYDTRLTRVLSAAEAKIRNAAGRPDGWLNTTAHVEKFETVTANAVSLRYDPVTVISTVSFVFASGSTQALASGNYRIDDSSSILRVETDSLSTWTGGFWPSAPLPVPPYQWAPDTTSRAYPYLQVRYIGGYAAGSIPADLEQAAVVVAASMAKQQGIDPNMKSETLGNYSYTFASPVEMNAWIDDQLAPYLRVCKGYFG